MSYILDQPIRYVRGIGPAKAKALVRLGIKTVGDLLDYHPLSYIFGKIAPIAKAAKDSGHVIIKGRIKSIFRLPSRVPIVESTIEDESGQLKARWFNTTWALSALHPGQTVWLWGNVKSGVLQQPRWSTISPNLDSICGGFYGDTHNQIIRMALMEVLANIELPDLWEGSSRVMVYEMWHNPETADEQKTAEYYLKFDELVQMQYALKLMRERQERKRGVKIWI